MNRRLALNRSLAPNMAERPVLRIALVGNPNTGRTTLFNRLTKTQHLTGNYPRVTVDVQTGVIEHQGWTIEVADLPGIYSLSCRSEEELQAREYIYHQRPDLLVNVVDMGNLERNLLLTTELIEMRVPLVIVLNMRDEALNKGIQLNSDAFSTILGEPVIEMEARGGIGVAELLDRVISLAEQGFPYHPTGIAYDQHLEQAIERIAGAYAGLHPDAVSASQARWLAIKLLEGDDSLLQAEADHSALMSKVRQERADLKAQHDEDAAMLLNNGRFGYVNGLLRETVDLDLEVALHRINLTRLLDSVLLHRFLGLPLFLFFMWLMFETTFTLGTYPMDWIDAGVRYLSQGVEALLPESLFKRMLIDGILAGVGGTIIFLPNVVILFIFIALFSETGYLSRSAFLIDRVMHGFGLHGKAFIPMITGFGCNVPAILATRTIENKKDRLVAMLVIPFMSCSARLPVFILITSVFFADSAGAVLFAMYCTSIIIALCTAVILSKTVVHGANTAPFLLELPPYRAPTLNSLMVHMGANALEFLKKVTSIIVVGSVIIWFLQTFPQQVALSKDFAQEIEVLRSQPESEQRDERVRALRNEQQAEIQKGRYLGQFGSAIQPIFSPLGFDLNSSIALLTGLVAKEVIVATFGVLYSRGEQASVGDAGLRTAVAGAMTATSAVAFMVFSLFYMPCLATLAMLYRETDSLGWTAFSVVLSLVVAYLLALGVVIAGP